MGFRAEAMCLEKSAIGLGYGRSQGDGSAGSVFVHVHCDSPCPQIANSKHAANNIPPQVVKHQYLPYWVSIFIQNRDRCRGYIVGTGIRIGMAVCGILGMI